MIARRKIPRFAQKRQRNRSCEASHNAKQSRFAWQKDFISAKIAN